ncbi:hypothetical protein ACGFT2_33775 [Streptomyces sp. NPDC048514]|uniref:hypothetical protein n=1 Tax=Streptomyces sp. NPDC048514 TaxID=3365564 RepID=UPI0037209429
MARGVAVLAVAVSASATVLSGPAAAATQFPSGSADGIRVDWSGEWANANRLQDITLQLCDATPEDKNRATAQLQGYVTRGGSARVETAPSVFQVPIGDKACAEWRDVFLTYFEQDDRLAYARVQFFGSQKPKEKHETKWVRNPRLRS